MLKSKRTILGVILCALTVIMLLMGCLALTACGEKKQKLTIECANCLVNSESTVSAEVEENAFVSYKLKAKENYLLPTAINVNSGNETLIQDKDYLYTISDDRLTGEISLKVTKEINISVVAEEQGYLFIGDNKIAKSGDYTYLEAYSSRDEKGCIIYDYKTNTLTLNNATLVYSDIGLHEFPFIIEDTVANDGLATFDGEEETGTIRGLIGWTGGGNLNLKILGENNFVLEGNKDECVFVTPITPCELNIFGTGSAYIENSFSSVIMNQRGITRIDGVLFYSDSLAENAIYSKELYINNSHISLTAGVTSPDSIGINAYKTFVNNSVLIIDHFESGIYSYTVNFVDTVFKTQSSVTVTGIRCGMFSATGNNNNGTYSSVIDVVAQNFGIVSMGNINFIGSDIKSVVEDGWAIVAADTTIKAIDSSIYAHTDNGEAMHAFAMFFNECVVNATATEGTGISSGINSAQLPGREYEPCIEIINSDITASGDIAIYGDGHFNAESCTTVPKYLEVLVDDEHERYLWSFVDESETELKYEVIHDIFGDYYKPTNALKEVSISATEEQSYLFIGNNKITQSGDYSYLNSNSWHDKNARGSIVFDSETNTLTLNNATLIYSDIGMHEFPFIIEDSATNGEFDTFEGEEVIGSIRGLIGWIGGENLNLRILGVNRFILEGNEEECVFVTPITPCELNIFGTGSAYIENASYSIILNQRGITTIDGVLFESDSLAEYGIYSKELYVKNSHLSLTADVTHMNSKGIDAYKTFVNNSIVEINHFEFGISSYTVDFVDTTFKTQSMYIGVKCGKFTATGYNDNGTYSMIIDIVSEEYGIDSIDSISFVGSEVRSVVNEGWAIITVDTMIKATDSSIYAHTEDGEALHAYAMVFDRCKINATATEGVGIRCSIHGAQGIGREWEPYIEITSSDITASGDIAMYGYGHFNAESCTTVPNHLEVLVDEDHELYLWAFVDESETELKYEKIVVGPSVIYEPTNALAEISIIG